VASLKRSLRFKLSFLKRHTDTACVRWLLHKKEKQLDANNNFLNDLSTTIEKENTKIHFHFRHHFISLLLIACYFIIKVEMKA
jgi:hypothetical protein